MKFYKVFSVEDGELYSAFEGHYTTGQKAKKKVHYQQGEVANDPKPRGCDCPGLMILCDLRKAVEFLQACPKSHTYALYEIDPRAAVTIPLIGLDPKYSYLSGHTDVLRVGSLIARNK